MPSAEKKKSVNAVSGSAESEKVSSKIRELKELVLGMNEKIRELERKAETTLTSRAGMRWYVLLAVNLAYSFEIVHTKKGETELGACRGPGSPHETWSSGPRIRGRQ